MTDQAISPLGNDPDSTQPALAPSTWRRLSHPPLPTFRPNIPNLRNAILGYLGEVEVALRSRLGELPFEEKERIRATSSSPSISGDEFGYSGNGNGSGADSVDDDFGGDTIRYGSSSSSLSSTSRNGYGFGQSSSTTTTTSEGLRNRFDNSTSTTLNQFHHGNGATSSIDNNYHLNLLSTIREEAVNHLSSLSVPSLSVTVPSLPIPSREWLKSLPSRLSSIDPGLSYSYGHNVDRKGKSAADGGLDGGELLTHDLGAIQSARKRVLEVVHTLLPSEEWVPWERLGWEEQEEEQDKDKRSKRARSHSLEKSILHDEEEEDEPEYLFPNRTPASAKAMARRRAVRSKSLGANSFPTIRKINHDDDIRRPISNLQRSKTADPYSKPILFDSDDDDDDNHYFGDARDVKVHNTESPALNDNDEEDEEYILKHPEITDTKLTALVAEDSPMGPTVQESLKRSNDGKRLIRYEDLPAVWRNNEHVHTGYRFIPLHLKTGPVPLIKSAFTWHNETINIHSHFIPTILISLFVPYILINSPLPNAHVLDTLILALYLIAAISCLFSSASWHVLSGCASKRWFEWGACVDYIGISWLIAASFGTVVYNGFYCQPKLVLLYCSINAFCGGLGSYLPFQKWFNERRNKHLRISFFLFLCFAMFAPMLQLFYQHGFTKALAFTAPFGWSIATYLTGLWFYAFHFPECRWPGKFDRWGMSHQWWHAGIVLAIWLHYKAVFVAHGMKYDYSCAAPGAGKSVAQVLEGWLIGH
ncbi:uncharacterized protein IL334_000827 [Kwoniella shivajii]|uniref:HlyIII-domain-containing protein n=1 Tax=Kwoniella shivajii TaxID=564305 RepID=A0ABZ1CQH5_9TREE|nr:hypothetical protein IL334_000827 [Kwoniella shivajii]